MKSSGLFYFYFLKTNQQIAYKTDYFNPILNLEAWYSNKICFSAIFFLVV